MKPKPATCKAETYATNRPDDPGKRRYCERKSGHTGRHMTTYCGKRKFWTK